MTEQTTPEPAAPAQAPDPAQDDATDWKAEARKWEQRAKENKSAADKLSELEAAQMSELEKVAEKAAKAEERAAKAEADALRLRIAAQHSISDPDDIELFLTGTDEETLTKQAQRLAQRSEASKKQGNHVPREGTTPRSQPEDEVREFSRNLFQAAD